MGDYTNCGSSAHGAAAIINIVCSNVVAANWCSLDFFSGSLCRPVFGDCVCPLCEREIPSSNSDHLNNG